MGFLYFYLISALICWLGMRYTIKYDINKIGMTEMEKRDAFKSIVVIFMPLLNLIAGVIFLFATLKDRYRDKLQSEIFLNRALSIFFLIRINKKEKN